MEAVAPHAGAWIEICLPCVYTLAASVAPHAGAWIEILSVSLILLASAGRSPRGSVD